MQIPRRMNLRCDGTHDQAEDHDAQYPLVQAVEGDLAAGVALGDAHDHRRDHQPHRAEREERRRPWHLRPQPAEPAHVARTRGMEHRAGAEEQQRFEEPVVPHVQQRAD